MNAIISSSLFVAPTIYLAILSSYPAARGTKSIHMAGLITGILSLAFLAGWLNALISVGLATALFLLLVFTRLFTQSTTVAVPVMLAALPVDHWWSLAFAAALAAIWSVAKLSRAHSRQQLVGMALQTANAVGATSVLAGKLPNQKPDLSALPIEADVKATGIPILPILGIALCVSAMITVVI